MYKNFSKVYDKFMEICDYNEWVKLLEKYRADFCPQGKKFWTWAAEQAVLL